MWRRAERPPLALTSPPPPPPWHGIVCQDRQYMGMSSKALDRELGVYILTVGVHESHRNCGIASSLLGLVYQHACNIR